MGMHMAQKSTQPLKRRPRGPSRYRRRETARLVRGVLDAGLPVRGVEVDAITGALRVLAGKPDDDRRPVQNGEGATSVKLVER